MKKILTVVLSVIICISFSSCGKESKDDMLKKATKTTNQQLGDELHENVARAKEKYVGKYFSVTGLVANIHEDHIDICAGADNVEYGLLSAYLPKDELISVQKSSLITVIGKIDELVTEKKSFEGIDYEVHSFVMKNAYIEKNEYTVSGTIMDIYR